MVSRAGSVRPSNDVPLEANRTSPLPLEVSDPEEEYDETLNPFDRSRMETDPRYAAYVRLRGGIRSPDDEDDSFFTSGQAPIVGPRGQAYDCEGRPISNRRTHDLAGRLTRPGLILGPNFMPPNADVSKTRTTSSRNTTRG